VALIFKSAPNIPFGHRQDAKSAKKTNHKVTKARRFFETNGPNGIMDERYNIVHPVHNVHLVHSSLKIEN
jgi:hypothetical protein